MNDSTLKTRIVFLDTQAYDNNSLQFAGPALKKLKELAAAGYLKLLTTEVVDREVRQHVQHYVGHALVSHQRLRKHAGMLQSLPTPQYAALFEELDRSKLLNLGMQAWEQFLAAAKVETIPVRTVETARLLELYFEQRPPFSAKKKSEFPDAITLVALEQWRAAQGKDVYLIGDDPDIKAWCEDTPGMHHVPFLKDFLDLYNRAEENLTQIALSIFEREEDEIIAEIKDAFVNCTFVYEQDWEADVENATISSTSVEDVSVIEIDERQFVLVVSMEITFNADVSGSHYDNPEYAEHYHVQVSDTEHFDVSFQVAYDLASKEVIDVSEIRFNDETQITISDPHSPYR